MTDEEIKALQDQLAATQTERDLLTKTAKENEAKLDWARRTVAGLNNIQDDRVKQYVVDLSNNRTPTPFWEASEQVDDVDDDMEKRLMAHMDKRIEEQAGLSRQQFEAVGNPLLALQRARTEEAAKAWAVTQYPTFVWDDFKAQLSAQAGEDAQSVLESLPRLQTYVKAYQSDHADAAGYQRATQENSERMELEGALLQPQTGGADRSVDSDMFEGVDPTNMKELMAAQLRHEGMSEAQLGNAGYPVGG